MVIPPTCCAWDGTWHTAGKPGKAAGAAVTVQRQFCRVFHSIRNALGREIKLDRILCAAETLLCSNEDVPAAKGRHGRRNLGAAVEAVGALTASLGLAHSRRSTDRPSHKPLLRGKMAFTGFGGVPFSPGGLLCRGPDK